MNYQLQSQEAGRPWGAMLGVGIFGMLLGAVAIARPMTSSVAIEVLIGLLLLAAGLADILSAVLTRRSDGWLARAALGALGLATGAALVSAPVVGLMSITLLLAAYFVAHGTMRIVGALRGRGDSGWGLHLIGGAAALVLGVLMFHGWPVDAAWAIGLLVGVHLIVGGTVTAGVAIAAAAAEDAAATRFDASEARMAA